MIRFKRGTICPFPFPAHKLVPFQIFQLLYLDHKLFKVSVPHSEGISTVSFSSSSFTQNLFLLVYSSTLFLLIKDCLLCSHSYRHLHFLQTKCKKLGSRGHLYAGCSFQRALQYQRLARIRSLLN